MAAMKPCSKCATTKPLAEFYKDKSHRDGFQSVCKECHKAAVMRRQRADPERHAEQCRAYYQANREVHAVKGRAWAQANPEKVAAYVKASREAHPERAAARTAVHAALKAGRIAKEPCARCGEEEVQGHHPDYAQPLAVEWLCFACHLAEHGRAVVFA